MAGRKIIRHRRPKKVTVNSGRKIKNGNRPKTGPRNKK